MKTLITLVPRRINTGTIALALFVAFTSTSWAQRQPATPEQRQESRDDRRQRIEQMAPEQRQQYFEQRMQERLKSMTPEQRERFEERRGQFEQMQRQARIASVSSDERQKLLMQSAGISQAAEQDAILAFVVAQAQQRQSVTAAATQLSTLLADAATTPEALSAQLAAVQTASKDFRTWKTGALNELDGKISYTKNPRLQSLLVLVGILGDESTDAGGFNAIFPKGVAGAGDIVDLLPKTEGNQGWGGRGE